MITAYGDNAAPSPGHPYVTLAEHFRTRAAAHLERARRAFDEGKFGVARDRFRKAAAAKREAEIWSRRDG